MPVGTHVVSHSSFICISPGCHPSEVAQWETWVTSKISLIETGISGAGAAKWSLAEQAGWKLSMKCMKGWNAV